MRLSSKTLFFLNTIFFIFPKDRKWESMSLVVIDSTRPPMKIVRFFFIRSWQEENRQEKVINHESLLDIIVFGGCIKINTD